MRISDWSSDVCSSDLSEDFDPAVDSYPRVMVGRLRSLLDRYYADTPWVHRLRVPQGSYEVVVQYRSEEHTSELQSLMRISYAVFCLKKKKAKNINISND